MLVYDCNELDENSLALLCGEEKGKSLSNNGSNLEASNSLNNVNNLETSNSLNNGSSLESNNSSNNVESIHSVQSNCLHFLTKSNKSLPLVFPSAYSILQHLCNQKSGINIPEIKMTTINRFSVYYFRLLSYNKSISNDMLVFLLGLFYQNVHCTHLLNSITRIFLNSTGEILTEIGFFEKMRVSIFSYAYSYNTSGISDSLFAFLIKIYAKFKNFLETKYISLLDVSETLEFTKDSWEGAHLLFEYFLRLEKYSYKTEECDSILEYEGFNRYIIDTLVSELPFSTVFTEY